MKPAYSVTHDCYFDIDKDEWIEPRCCDMNCAYCKDRPSRPSQVVDHKWEPALEWEVK